MPKTAIKPNFFINVPALAKVQASESVTDEEKSLYAMSKTSGWVIFKKIAEDTVLQLGNVNKAAIAQGLPLEEIGRNAIVVNLAQEAIERLLNRVIDISEAIEKKE